jgi:hypothetical protein
MRGDLLTSVVNARLAEWRLLDNDVSGAQHADILHCAHFLLCNWANQIVGKYLRAHAKFIERAFEVSRKRRSSVIVTPDAVDDRQQAMCANSPYAMIETSLVYGQAAVDREARSRDMRAISANCWFFGCVRRRRYPPKSKKKIAESKAHLLE